MDCCRKENEVNFHSDYDDAMEIYCTECLCDPDHGMHYFLATRANDQLIWRYLVKYG